MKGRTNMKTIKLYTGSLILICLVLAAGCSDHLISPESMESSEINSSELQMNFEEGVFNEKFALNPGESKLFHYGNTGLILINSYTVSNCSFSSRELTIRSSIQADSTSLPCSWKKQGSFAFEDLTIKNISSGKKTISVYLRGLIKNN